MSINVVAVSCHTDAAERQSMQPGAAVGQVLSSIAEHQAWLHDRPGRHCTPYGSYVHMFPKTRASLATASLRVEDSAGGVWCGSKHGGA